MLQADNELLDKIQKLLSLSEKNFTEVKPREHRVCDDQKALAMKYKTKQESKEDRVAIHLKLKELRCRIEMMFRINFQEIWATCAGSQIKLFKKTNSL